MRHGLGQRFGICEHLSQTHYLSHALTAGLPAKFAGKPSVVGDENTLCEHHLRSQRTPVRRFDTYLRNSICISSKIEYVGDPSQMHRGPLGQIAERCQLQPATTSQVGPRDMRTNKVHVVTRVTQSEVYATTVNFRTVVFNIDLNAASLASSGTSANI